jgi:hypothetical protein
MDADKLTLAPAALFFGCLFPSDRASWKDAPPHPMPSGCRARRLGAGANIRLAAVAAHGDYSAECS